MPLMRLLLALGLIAPCLAHAGAAAPPQGVWTGTLGTKAIVACFNAGSPTSGNGSYYYLDHLTPIGLSLREADGAWQEADDTGAWTLSPPAQGVVTGRWRHPKTGKSLPIRLQDVQEAGNETACASDAYNRRLERTPAVVKGPLETFAPGRSYRKLVFAGQETLELQGPDPALPRLNRQLSPDQSAEAVQAYFSQRREFLGRVGYPAVDEHHADPVHWDANFITIKFHTWVAGEGRGGISTDYRTWSTRTGEPVDPWTWIGATAESRQLPAGLKKRFYRGLKEEPQCLPDYRGRGDFTLTFDASGLHFDEEAWGEGCEKSFVLPFDEAGPYLTPAGKKAAAALRGR